MRHPDERGLWSPLRRRWVWAFAFSLGWALSGCGNGGSWEKVGGPTATPGGASWVSLDGRQGNLYLAFQDAGMDNRVSVLKSAGGIWSPLGKPGFSRPGIISGVSLSVDAADGTPYVAYRISKIELVKQAGGKPKPKVSSQTYVEKYNGEDWKPVGRALPGDDAPVFLAGAGMPYLASTDAGRVEVQKFDGKSWRKCGDKTLTATGYPFTWGGLYVDPSNGQVYVAVRNEAKDWAFVAKDTGRDWEILGKSFIPGTKGADNGCLWVDRGRVYLAFRDVARGGKASAVFFDGDRWIPLGAQGFSDGPVAAMSFRVVQGVPYLAYQDARRSNRATVLKFDGGVWRPLGREGFTDGPAAFVSLTVDEATQTPYLAYQAASSGGKAVVEAYHRSGR